MSYYISTTLKNTTFEEAIEKTTAASMMAVQNDALAGIAKDVQKKLTKVIKSI